MSKTAKQTLVTELTTALVAVSPPLSLPLPRGIAQAVDHLADSILRWQARQERPVRASGRTEPSTSDALVLLMNNRLEEETESPFHEVEEGEGAFLAPASAPDLPAVSTSKQKRPRLLKPLPPQE